MNRWQAVVFDLDDTLYPERQYVLSGMRAVAAWAEGELGLPAERTLRELQGLFERGVRGDTFNQWLRGHGLERDRLVQHAVQVYRDHTPTIEPYAPVPDLLRRLGASLRLGLVTDGQQEVQRRKLAALGLEGLFQAIVYSDALGRDAWKPSPRPFRRVLELLGVPAHAAIYVADNPTKDFHGARAVGMATLRLRLPDGLYRGLEPANAADAPDREIDRFEALEEGIASCP